MSLFPRFTQEYSPLFRLLDDYERHALRGSSSPSLQTFSPKFDVKELKDSYELHGEFPGVEQKNISIEWTDANTLTITGRHESVREEGTRPQASIAEGAEAKDNKAHQPTVEDETAPSETQVTKTSSSSSSDQQQVAKKPEHQPKYWVSERSVGAFHRSFNFPTRVDQDAVKASLKDGILSVIVPKAKKETPRKVIIE